MFSWEVDDLAILPLLENLREALLAVEDELWRRGSGVDELLDWIYLELGVSR